MNAIRTGLTSVTFRQKTIDEIVALARKAQLDGIEWGGDVHVPAGDVQAARHATGKQGYLFPNLPGERLPIQIGLGLEQRRAFATSVAVILPLSAVSLVVFVMKGGLDFMAALPYLIGGLAGGILSGLVFKKVSVTLLRRAFGLLILYGGVKALFLL